jgi:hypothetical protein
VQGDPQGEFVAGRKTLIQLRLDTRDRMVGDEFTHGRAPKKIDEAGILMHTNLFIQLPWLHPGYDCAGKLPRPARSHGWEQGQPPRHGAPMGVRLRAFRAGMSAVGAWIGTAVLVKCTKDMQPMGGLRWPEAQAPNGPS